MGGFFFFSSQKTDGMKSTVRYERIEFAQNREDDELNARLADLKR